MNTVEYTERFIYQSNQWYNDGLKKATIRDMSGAIVSLKKSLQYNRDNIPARNLLGLVYYGRGEVAEALVEWIISKNIKTHGNIATYYIKKVQESASELESINEAIKKYNQSLVYCEQGGEDLAAIQLRKVVSMHPTFLRAHQLLALIYIETEQYAKARQALRKAHKLDATNETTLRYMHELKCLHNEKAVKLKEGKDQSVSYKLGNETIIQPISALHKESLTRRSVLWGLLGIVIGAAIVWFLITPTVRQKVTDKTNKEMIAYSEQIATLKTEIDLVNQELNKYISESEETQKEKAIAKETKGSYEKLVSAIEHYYEDGYSRSKLVDELLKIERASLGNVGKTTFDEITKEVYAAECEELYEPSKRNYEVANYKAAIERLERITKMNEKYADGEAILLLMQAYEKNGNEKKADQTYQRILELYAEKNIAKKAKEFMEK